MIEEFLTHLRNWFVRDIHAGPYQSESFGGYTYTMKADNGGGNGGATSWQSAFAARMNKWRKL